MGSLAIAFLQSTPNTITMKYSSALLVLAFAAYAQAGQWVYVEDPCQPPAAPAVYHHLSRRAAQGELQPIRYPGPPPAPALYEPDLAVAGSTPYAAPHKGHGRVGPVYTFVKTDPKANFKWGVRHVAGVQYGR